MGESPLTPIEEDWIGRIITICTRQAARVEKYQKMNDAKVASARGRIKALEARVDEKRNPIDDEVFDAIKDLIQEHRRDVAGKVEAALTMAAHSRADVAILRGMVESLERQLYLRTRTEPVEVHAEPPVQESSVEQKLQKLEKSEDEAEKKVAPAPGSEEERICQGCASELKKTDIECPTCGMMADGGDDKWIEK